MLKSICIMVLGCFLFGIVAALAASGAVYAFGVSPEFFDVACPIIGMLFGLWWGSYCFNKWGR